MKRLKSSRSITYDKENTRIYATGNVEIIDQEFKLYANKVFVNNESRFYQLEKI